MIEFSLSQRLFLKTLFAFLKLINILNFELKWMLFILFTFSLTLTFWNFKDTSLDDFMKMTRRKPVLSLAETIPESIIKTGNSEAKLVLSETNLITTEPAERVLKLKPLNLYAKSYLIFDLKNNKELISKDKNLQLAPASLVKVLSVMYLTKDLNFSDVYEMTLECTLVNGQKVGFKVGEKISVKDLVYSSLIFSGADSICLLSRTKDNLNIEGMNQFAKSLGMRNSNFTNFIGLDFANNYTTSEDMVIMTQDFLKKEIFSEIVKMKSYKLQNGRVIYNTNKMLFSDKFSAGVKTGTTDGANENLIYRFTDKSRDIDLIFIILNSGDRYADTKQIINGLYFE
jgi:D-alanyl-D-alanine carboxypeptidase